MNDKLDLVRRRITAKMDESQRKQLKGLRFIFLRNNEDLPEDAKLILRNMRRDREYFKLKIYQLPEISSEKSI